MKLVLGVILGFFLLTSLASALYADITIDVTNTGLVTVEGTTDNPDILVERSSEFTSKDGKYWVVNVTHPGVYSDIAYQVQLPKGSKVNYMRLPSFGQIEENDGILVRGSAQNAPLTFILQYEIVEDDRNRLFTVIIISLIVFMAAFLYILRRKKQRAIPTFDLQDFPDRQQEILKILLAHKGRLTQAKLEKITGLPKSSLSRNIDSLVKKGTIEKVSQGMSNLLKIK